MSRKTTTNEIYYICNGVSKVFTFDFPAVKADDIKVYLRYADETFEELSGYTVQLTDVGGSVTLQNAPTSGLQIWIRREVGFTQESTWTTSDAVDQSTFTNALDKLTDIAVDLNTQISKKIGFKKTSNNKDIVIEDMIAGRALIVNETGDGLEWSKDTFNNIVDNANSILAQTQAVKAAAEVSTEAIRAQAVVDVNGIKTATEAIRDDATASKNAATAQATIATTQAANASASADRAALSEAKAANYAANFMFNEVLDVSADVAITNTDNGKLYRVNASANNVNIYLPKSSVAGEPFKISIGKNGADTNYITVFPSSGDTINKAVSYVIASAWSMATFVCDVETGDWFVQGSGASAGNVRSDSFVSNGINKVFTLSSDPLSKNNISINVGGIILQSSEFTVVNNIITLNEAAPENIAIEIKYGSPISIGTPADGTVSTIKVQDAAITSAKIDPAYTASIQSSIQTAVDLLKTVPQVLKSNNIVANVADVGKSYDTTGNEVKLPLTDGWPIGAIICITNLNATAISITGGTGVTVRLAGTATTGTRTLAGYGCATARIIAVNTWMVSGAGLS